MYLCVFGACGVQKRAPHPEIGINSYEPGPPKDSPGSYWAVCLARVIVAFFRNLSSLWLCCHISGFGSVLAAFIFAVRIPNQSNLVKKVKKAGHPEPGDQSVHLQLGKDGACGAQLAFSFLQSWTSAQGMACAHVHTHTHPSHMQVHTYAHVHSGQTHTFKKGLLSFIQLTQELRDDYKSRQVTRRLTIKREFSFFLFCGSGYWIQGPTELLSWPVFYLETDSKVA